MVKMVRRSCYVCKEPSFGLMCRACISGKSGSRNLTLYRHGHKHYLKRLENAVPKIVPVEKFGEIDVSA